MNNPTNGIDPSGYFGIGDVFGAIGDAIGDITDAIGGAAGAVGHAFATAGSWIGANAGTIGIVVGVAAVSFATFGAADVAFAGVLGGFGAAVIAGAVSGAAAGALSSQLLGGGFSWQAVKMGALSGAVGAGIGNLASGFGAIARIGGSAIGGGLSSWTVSVAQGDPSWRSFYQGAAIGALTGAVTVGLQYLNSSCESEAGIVELRANRSPAADGLQMLEDAYNPKVGEYQDTQMDLGFKALTSGYEVVGSGDLAVSSGLASIGAGPRAAASYFSGFLQGLTNPANPPALSPSLNGGWKWWGGQLGSHVNPNAYSFQPGN